MKSIKFLLCLGLAVAAARAADTCPMQMPAAYSAEMETTASGMKMTSKMFVDGQKMRTESDAGGMASISIMRPDKKMAYTLMPAQKMVMESALPDAPEPVAAPAAGPAPAWVKGGTIKINGQDCTEYRVTTGGETVTYFINADKFPVRMVTSAATIEYKNIKIGAPDAALFEVPAGYNKPGEAPAETTVAPAADNGAPAKEEPKKKKKIGGMLGR